MKSQAELALAPVRLHTRRARLAREQRDQAIRVAVKAGNTLRAVAEAAELAHSRVWVIANRGDG